MTEHVELSAIEKDVLFFLRRAQGYKLAVKTRVLAGYCSKSIRVVRSIVAGLVKKGFLIGSHQRYGLFMILDHDDYRAAAAELESIARSLMERRAALQNNWRENQHTEPPKDNITLLLFPEMKDERTISL